MTAYLTSHALALLAVATWLVMLARLSRSRRAPQSTFAWLLAFALVPLLAIPLYLALGDRKFPRRAKGGQLTVPPTRPGSSFELLSSGERAFSRLMELIVKAERSIDLTMFILGRDATGHAVVAALAESARRGVEVRVILDAVGSFWSHRQAARTLRAAGAQLRLFMPLRHSPLRGRTNLRSHRKIAIIDSRVVFTGGMNLASEYMGTPRAPDTGPRWRDVAAIVEGPVAADAGSLFNSDWEYCGGGPTPADEHRPANQRTACGEERLQFVASGPDLITDAMYDLFLQGIFGARRRIALVTPYFVPDEALQHALLLAVRRGTKIDLVLPAWSNHRIADMARRDFLRELCANGVVVHYYVQGMVHAKAMVIDDDFAYIGSPNFDMRSLFLNYENAVCAYSPGAIAQVRDFIDSLISECAAEAPPFPERPILEQVALLLAPEL